MAKRKPQSIECTDCDAGTGMDLQDALDEGWKDLEKSESSTAYYCGQCVECQIATLENEIDWRKKDIARLKKLVKSNAKRTVKPDTRIMGDGTVTTVIGSDQMTYELVPVKPRRKARK